MGGNVVQASRRSQPRVDSHGDAGIVKKTMGVGKPSYAFFRFAFVRCRSFTMGERTAATGRVAKSNSTP